MYKNHIDKLRQNFVEAYNNGDVLKAILTGERILKIYEENNGTQTAYYADDAFNLACVYSKEGKLSKSTQLYNSAAEIIESHYGKNLKYSDILNNMAIDFNLMGLHNKSLEYFEEVYRIRKEILQIDNKDFVDSIFNLGGAYFDTEDFDNALAYHKEALNYRNEKDLDYADNLNMIGYDYEEQGEFEKSAEYFEEALDIIKKIEGARSEEYLKNLYYLGFVYEKAKNYVEAKNCYEKAVELIKTHIGESHPYYAEALNKLANMYFKCGNENKSLTLRMKALNLIKTIVGDNHIYYASNLKNIADIYLKKGDYARAEKMYLEELEIKERILGKDSEEYIKDLNLLCKVYIKSEKFDKAVPLLKETLENSEINKDLYMAFLLDLAYIYVKTCNTSQLYSIYEKFAELEPGLSFDEMLEDIKDFEESKEDFETDDFDELDGFDDF